MVEEGKLARLQITGSLDAWGPQEEYVRWGLDLNEWQENWEYCLNKPWIVMSINSAITSLTIKTMPELLEKISAWNNLRPVNNKIFFSFMAATNPHELVPDIFGPGVFTEDFKRIMNAMPDYDIGSQQHMEGIIKQIENSPRNGQRIADLKTYLTELDRRRGTSWPTLFPWLVELN